MRSATRTVPYFSQWESRELTNEVLANGAAAALVKDPKWASSGAHTIEEYARWANSLCGMACLKMVIAARTGERVSTMGLARTCSAYGGYVVNDQGDIKGLIYRPFVDFVAREFQISAKVVTGVTAEDWRIHTG
jgi:hypothetical protein